MSAMFLVPLTEKGDFKELVYRSIPKHNIDFTKQGMKVQVNSSAMPLIYPLKEKVRVSGIELKGNVDKLVQFKQGISQGTIKGKSHKDDYILRIGLVLDGDKRLNWFQKKISPAWVLKLYALAPEGEGIERIQFYNVTQQKEELGKGGVHPLGKGLIHDKNQWLLSQAGDFSFSMKLNEERKVHALWISIDGDDTKSKYTLTLKELKLSLHESKVKTSK